MAVGSDGKLTTEALKGLSEWDRAILYRSYYLRRTTTQIAEEFSTDDELVKQHLHRALHALRAAVQHRHDIPRRRLRVV
jgi:RNA polymerase sigma-70 factor (ECF subfamily)